MPILGGVLFALFVVLVITVPRLIYTCSPNEVLVFSGRRHGERHYRIVKGGWALRVPLFEKVDRVDLTNMNIEVAIQNAYSKGGIPLNITGIANVKVAGQSPGLDNAVQRLLGKPRPQVQRIAKETLEGYVRGVLASLTPEEVNEDTQAFERELRQQGGEGLDRLGLTLDNLKIQSITDDVGYLTAVGRIVSAELSRDNRRAEAERRAESLVEQAEANKRGALAKIQAQLEITRAESVRRVANAETAKHAYVAEQEGEVAALITRARAELGLQDARIAQAKHQLQAEVVTPARAAMEAQIAEARGAASTILETGRAQAEALRQLAEQWRGAGEAAQDVFLLQKLETILPTFLRSIRHMKVDQITMLQGGGQTGLAQQALGTVKALEAGGVDISGLLRRLSGDSATPKPVPQARSTSGRGEGASRRQEAPASPPPLPAVELAPPPPPPPLANQRGFHPIETRAQTGRQGGGEQRPSRLIRKREQ